MEVQYAMKYAKKSGGTKPFEPENTALVNLRITIITVIPVKI